MTRLATTAWTALALPASSLDHLSIEGDGALPSAFAVTDFAADAIGVAALSVAELLGTRAVRVDRRRASLWFGSSIQPVGWTMPDAWDAIAGDYAAADGWIRLHTNAPMHRAAAVRVLDCAGDRASVAKAVSRWSADDLETAVVDVGGCAATMRGAAAWDAHPQGTAVRSEPLIAVDAVPGSSGDWRPGTSRPLDGLRVLDLTRVLAGPVATRFLAGYGADVLRIDPPGWDEPTLVPDVTLGKRCARLDLGRSDDRRTFEALLADADVLVHGYRPDALDALGYDAATRRTLQPALIDVSLDAYGWSGPWRRRRGFDSLVQMSSGIAAAGMAWQRADRPVPLPVQALDHATGYLMAAAVVAGLHRRLVHGEASTARLSLARTARALVDAGGPGGAEPWSPRTDEDLASASESTAWGPARRVLAPVAIEGAPMAWGRAASLLGSAPPQWADR